MAGRLWRTVRAAAAGYVADACLSRGAAIAYYTAFSLAPVLLIVIAIAGFAFGEDTAQGAVVGRVADLMGKQGADAIQAMLQSAGNHRVGLLATIIGAVTLFMAASGIFGEMQAALNAVWKTSPPSGALLQLIRARMLSLALVLVLGFLLLVSLIATTALAALDTWLSAYFPSSHALFRAINFVVSFVLITTVFAAIYKILPDTDVDWRDVGIGAAVTTLLFTLGKYLIGLYLASGTIASTYGAAGALGIVLVWIYYSSQIFLFGAEFTRAYAQERGSPAGLAVREHVAEIDRLKAALRAHSRRGLRPR